MQRLPIVLLLLLIGALQPAWAGEGNSACALPPELTTPSDPMQQVAAALAARHALNILALGSGSTVGESGASGGPGMKIYTPQSSFPYRMVDALRSMRPNLQFNLSVQGGPSMTAEAMLSILQAQLAAHHFDLVLWQTGTVEAVHGLRPDVLSSVLDDGVEATLNAHANLVLVDPQFSRFLRANADLNPYETVLEQVATTQGVTLFPRFDLTKEWVDSGEIDLERVGRDQRDTTIARLNTCLGEALARYVLTGADEH